MLKGEIELFVINVGFRHIHACAKIYFLTDFLFGSFLQFDYLQLMIVLFWFHINAGILFCHTLLFLQSLWNYKFVLFIKKCCQFYMHAFGGMMSILPSCQ